MELKNLNVTEMSKEEMKNQKGGFFFVLGAIALCCVGAGAIITSYAQGVAARQQKVNDTYDKIMSGDY